MPKESRRRTSIHHRSVKSTRLADQGNVAENTAIENYAETSASNTVELPNVEEKMGNLTKKEKQRLKRELFLQGLETGSAPYSKSHARRLKRKSREKIAGGLDELQVAITLVEDVIPVAIKSSVQEATEDGLLSNPSTRVKPKPGQIGEGKAAPLSQTQRKKALRVEQLRHPLILSNPDYLSSPFETIRKHVQNTLVKHQAAS